MAETNERVAVSEEEKEHALVEQAELRDKKIIRTSVIGIIANVLLSVFKAIVGLLTHSIAIILDSVNNLSDAGSSIITIVGTRLASKQPDKKHPFGHGRVEYLSAMLIAVIILYAGLTSLIESIKKIITPVTPDYTISSLVIVAVAVAVKIILGKYVKNVGLKVNSDSLVNSGEDALLDAIISVSTLVAAIVFIATGLSLEAWLGTVISLLIIKSGVDMLRETISKILGESADGELARAIKETVLSFPGVSGAYDLVLNNYGPERFNGSVHIEIPDTYSAAQLDELIRSITTEVYIKHNVVLTAIGVYSVNTRDDEAARIRDAVYNAALEQEYVTQVHAFYLNEEKKTIRFDAVIGLDAPDRRSVYNKVVDKIKHLYPDYTPVVAMDTDFTEM